jgi:hypothetical protein
MTASTDSIEPLETLMESNGLNITNWDTPIYRVLPLHRFKDMIINKTTGLVRPSKWDDPFENFVLKCNVQTPDGLASLKPFHDRWYGQCWTMHRDSDAMWRIYSKEKDGVRVSTTIRKLFQAICDTSDQFVKLKFFIGQVQYHERSEIEEFLRNISFSDLAFGGQNNKFASTLCIKRPEFEHEKELRVLIHDADQSTTGDVLIIRFEYDAALDDAVFDPRLSDAEFQKLKKEVEGLGCSLPISQSDLYRMNEVIIPLE